jgi:hypothetical protein
MAGTTGIEFATSAVKRELVAHRVPGVLHLTMDWSASAKRFSTARHFENVVKTENRLNQTIQTTYKLPINSTLFCILKSVKKRPGYSSRAFAFYPQEVKVPS